MSSRGSFRARPASASSSGAFASTRQRPASASTSGRPSSQRLAYDDGGSGSVSGLGGTGRVRPSSRDVEGDLLAAHMHSSMHLSQEEKERTIESLAAEQNGYLLMLLEKEQANESERVRLLASIDVVGDQRRLEKIFAIERAKAAAVIKAVTRQHERALATKMEQLGLIEDDEDDEHFRDQRTQQTQYDHRR